MRVTQQTKIGQTIGKLRNNEDKATSQAAKALVAGWKTEVDKQRASSVKKKDSGECAAASASFAELVTC